MSISLLHLIRVHTFGSHSLTNCPNIHQYCILRFLFCQFAAHLERRKKLQKQNIINCVLILLKSREKVQRRSQMEPQPSTSNAGKVPTLHPKYLRGSQVPDPVEGDNVGPKKEPELLPPKSRSSIPLAIYSNVDLNYRRKRNQENEKNLASFRVFGDYPKIRLVKVEKPAVNSAPAKEVEKVWHLKKFTHFKTHKQNDVK